MGADGHIAIYDWEKVREFLLKSKEHYAPKYKTSNFETYEEATKFADEHDGSAGSKFKWGKKIPAMADDIPESFEVAYTDHNDLEPPSWPGYVCDWSCNGKQACIIYWGDNIDYWPFEGMEWLEEWADKNARLVANQEVWT